MIKQSSCYRRLDYLRPQRYRGPRSSTKRTRAWVSISHPILLTSNLGSVVRFRYHLFTLSIAELQISKCHVHITVPLIDRHRANPN